MRRSGHLRRGIAATALLVLAAPVGLAHLAGNTVEPTRAGVHTRPVTIPTDMTALGLDDGRLLARLTAGDQPLAGLSVDFVLPEGIDPARCQGVLTDAAGVATCDPGDPGDIGGFAPSMGYSAVFAGAGALAPATDYDAVPLDATTGEAPTDEVPTGEAPTDEVPTDEVPTDEAPTDAPPTRESPPRNPASGTPPPVSAPAGSPPSTDPPPDHTPSDAGPASDGDREPAGSGSEEPLAP